MGLLKRSVEAFDDRTGLVKTTGEIMRHPVPPTRGATGWMYVFGTATLFSFIVAVVSGIPLASQYVDSTDGAYASLQWITHGAILGNQIRAIHFYSSDAMLIFIGIHVLRVFLTGAFKFPREVNWLSGVVLLLLTLAIVFTGQILRWDQNGVWTILIVSAQANRVPIIGNWLSYFLVGGHNINGTTLSRFFTLHVFILPGLLFAIIAFHLYLVLHDGISEPPQVGRPVDPKTYRSWYNDMLKREGVPFWPDAAWRDAVFGVAVITGIVALAILIGAPELVGPPDPSNLIAEPRPDWYFTWYFGALALLPKDAEDTVMILGPALFFLAMFLVPFFGNRGERNPLRRPWAVGVAWLAIIMIGTMTVSGDIAGWSPRFNAPPLTAAAIAAPRGSAIYQGAVLWHTKSCEYCHMIDGVGGIRGPDLTDVGSRLTPYELTVRILNGGDNMPAFASLLKPAEVTDLVAFLSSRKGYHGQFAGKSGRVATGPEARLRRLRAGPRRQQKRR